MCWLWDYSRSNKYDCNDNNCTNVEVSVIEGEKVKDSVAETVPSFSSSNYFYNYSFLSCSCSL